MKSDKWTLNNIPPVKHADVAEFAAQLFDIAKTEKERLGKPGDFLANYALYRGANAHRQQSYPAQKSKGPSSLVNLFFANIERTVSNITAREPVGEVVDLSGAGEDLTQVMTMRLQKWWKDTNQQIKTRGSARTMEIYGITPEKPYYDKVIDDVGIMLTDPFQFFPAPGYYEQMDIEAPFVCFAYVDIISKIEREFKVKEDVIAPDVAYDLMGTEREEYKPRGGVGGDTVGHYSDRMIKSDKGEGRDSRVQQCLIVEVWVRDERKSKKKEPAIMADPETGEIGMVDVEEEDSVYPDHIRKITITKAKDEGKHESGWMILDDSANPNINPALDRELAKNTHPWGRFPVYYANSYRDLVSIWGFSAAEQTSDLIGEINSIIRKIVGWVKDCTTPPIVLPKNIGITREMIESNNNKAGRLVLQPSNYIAAAAIRYLETPNLPATFYQTLDRLIDYYDRTYQIEDADRGQAPGGVIAAKAIVALQERNQVVMQSKTSSIDNLAENRSRWAIGLWQNFSTDPVSVNKNGEQVPFIGTDYAGMKFGYVVEAGSTTPRTNLQVQEMAGDLFQMGLIDQEAALKLLNVPGWKEIIERMSADQYQQTFEALVERGAISEEEAQALYQALVDAAEEQGGKGTQAGQPKKKEGQDAGV